MSCLLYKKCRCYLCNMRPSFIRILLLFVGFTYASSVFEFDKGECSQNYSKELCQNDCCPTAFERKTVSKISKFNPALLRSRKYYFLTFATSSEIKFLSDKQIISANKICLRRMELLI